MNPIINYLSKQTKDEASDNEPAKEKPKSQRKKKKQVIEESSSEEEPKTYEINEASVPEATYEDLD